MDETLQKLSDLIEEMESMWQYRRDPCSGCHQFEGRGTPDYAPDLRSALESALEDALEQYQDEFPVPSREEYLGIMEEYQRLLVKKEVRGLTIDEATKKDGLQVLINRYLEDSGGPHD